MNITVQRQWFTDLSTCATMSLDGNFECYTLEPPVRETKPCCIPAGSYQVELAMSSKLGYVVPCVLDVPGFTAIEIHRGNASGNTDGCCLVGQSRATDWGSNSADAFAALMAKLQNATNSISITYVVGVEEVYTSVSFQQLTSTQSPYQPLNPVFPPFIEIKMRISPRSQ